MIRICNKTYPVKSEYDSLFDEYPYELDHFQKYGIQAIEESAHLLVTAGTGSGKSLLCDHAIRKYCRNGKKVIYTSPIKSLSNQKFHEYTLKYPDVSFGILTGDIKYNPEADCIIMTTEILRNTLFRNNDFMQDDGSSFHMDINNDLACVVFDEIHYINDRDRGKVWEETIIKLPSHIQIVMLSATIDRPEEFTKWVADTKNVDVWLTTTDVRVVPLNHYSYFKLPESVLEKKVKDPELIAELNSIDGKIIELKKHTRGFKSEAVSTLHRVSRKLDKYDVYSKNKFVLNQISEFLHIEMMLPAICFVFSRKKVVEYAKSIEHQLFRGDEQQLRSKVEQECQQILMKLPNYKEYMLLPEYIDMIKLLQKGIAVHHSGILPILREMVELLFSKGYVKLLFATETFAVGVNMPTKTVLFTSLEKFDGNRFRYLHSHEYTQMAGRAGRRGMDKVGHVIHLNNMFDTPMIKDYQSILDGSPQTLISKFQIDFSLLLRVFGNTTETDNDDRLNIFVGQSMISNEIEKQYDATTKMIEKTISELEYLKSVTHFGCDAEIISEYKKLKEEAYQSSNKKRKRIINRIRLMETDHETLKIDLQHTLAVESLESKLKDQQSDRDYTSNYVKDTIKLVREQLFQHNFITDLSGTLSPKGEIASELQELNSLAFAEIFNDSLFNSIDVIDLVMLLSSFTDIRISEDHKIYSSVSKPVNDILSEVKKHMDYYYDLEQKCGLYIDESRYKIIYDLQQHISQWCEAKTEVECKCVISDLEQKGVFIGEFVKAILKINNIAHEIDKICNLLDLVDLKHKLSLIPELTLKFIATNQSLYI